MVQIIAKAYVFSGLAGKVIDSLLQLGQIVQPVFLAAGAEHGLVAAVLQNACQKVCQVHGVVDGPVFFNQPHIVLCPAPAEAVGFQIVKQRLIQRNAMGGGVAFQRGDPGAAHSPPGLVDRAQKADIVRAVDHSQIAQHILDLPALVKLHAGIEHIGNFAADQGFLQCPGDIVGPVQYSHGGIRQSPLPFVEGPHVGSDPVGFQLGGCGVKVQRLAAVRAHGGEVLFQPVPVFGDQGIGRRENLGRRAVVLVQINGFGTGMTAGELQNKLHIRPPPGIDGLIRVAHHEEIPVIAAEDVRQCVLIFVDILKLIHHDVFEPLLPLFPDLPALLQNIQRKVDEIVNIQTVTLALLVEKLVQNPVPQSGGGGGQLQKMVHIRVDEGFYISPAALTPADIVDGLLHRNVLCGNAQGFKHGGKHRLLVLLVHHKKAFGVLHHMAVLFQQAHAEAVEGGDPGQILIRQLASDPLFHFVGRFVGKGDAKDVGRGDAQCLHQIQIACRKGFGFAGACAGHHPDTAFGSGGGLPLLGIQPLQIVKHISSPLFFLMINQMFANVHCLFCGYNISSLKNIFYETSCIPVFSVL